MLFLLNIIRALIRLVKLLLFAFFAAVALRWAAIVPPEVLPYFWLAVGAGLLVVAGPMFSFGWNEHARGARDAAIRKAEEQYERERR